MTVARTGALRTALRVGVLVAVWLVAAAAHVWYGNRHDFYDLRIYAQAMRWWTGGHPLYSFTQPDNIQGLLGFTYPPFAAILLFALPRGPIDAPGAVGLA